MWQNSDLNRKKETVIKPLRIGHTFTAHNHLMARINHL